MKHMLAAALMPALLLCALLQHQLPASARGVHLEGIAKFYSNGVMQRVAAHRHMAMRHDVAGYASTPDCSRIGQVITASFRNPRTRAWSAPERFQVLDCSAPRDRGRHLRERLVIEVDYATARRHGFAGEGKTEALVVYP